MIGHFAMCDDCPFNCAWPTLSVMTAPLIVQYMLGSGQSSPWGQYQQILEKVVQALR